ncbi:MAG: glycosyltransferase family 39 protein, partial [Anaerolineae bacterium]|nr:glycosyltransferase family 39 protein [Anaerolineae bacterium]
MIYSIVIPLWHAADEVNHAEYIMFIVRERRFPQPGEAIPELRRDLWASLIESGIPTSQLVEGALLSETPPPIPGPSEFRHPPAYYVLEAMSLWPLVHHDVMIQAYAARIVSMLLGTLTLGVIVLSARTLFPEQPWLTLGVPLLVLFIPAHTFTNSTINNDQLAELLMSVFFYLWLLIFRSGVSAGLIAGVISVTALGLFTKRTTVLSVPLSLVALLILASRHLEHAKRWLRWTVFWGLIIGAIGLGTAALHRGAVASWYTSSPEGTSLSSSPVKSGKHSMQLTLVPGRKSITVYQVLPPQAVEALQGEKVSFGVWTSGSEDTNIQLQVSDGNHNYRKEAESTTDWQLHEVTRLIDPNASELRVTITVRSSSPVSVYC